MKVYRFFWYEEIEKLAKGEPMDVPEAIVLASAMDALKRYQRDATKRARKGKRVTKRRTNDSVAFLERLYRLEDPRD